MAARKTKPVIVEVPDNNDAEVVIDVTQEPPVQKLEGEAEKLEPTEFESFRLNLIQLGNEMIDKVRGKQVDVCDGIDKIASIYNAVK